MRRSAAAAMLLFALTGGACPKANEMKPGEAGPDGLRPPRDGDVAIREELEAARRAGTLAAYDLFLARHPDHVLAETARRERARIAAASGK